MIEALMYGMMPSAKIVICDRFTDSTVAYQGCGRGLDLTTIDYLNRLAAGELKPRLTILLDCPVETGLERAFARINGLTSGREERFELESVRFHQRVRDGYLKLAGAEPERFIIIDGSLSLEKTEAAVISAVTARLAEG